MQAGGVGCVGRCGAVVGAPDLAGFGALAVIGDRRRSARDWLRDGRPFGAPGGTSEECARRRRAHLSPCGPRGFRSSDGGEDATMECYCAWRSSADEQSCLCVLACGCCKEVLRAAEGAGAVKLGGRP